MNTFKLEGEELYDFHHREIREEGIDVGHLEESLWKRREAKKRQQKPTKKGQLLFVAGISRWK